MIAKKNNSRRIRFGTIAMIIVQIVAFLSKRLRKKDALIPELNFEIGRKDVEYMLANGGTVVFKDVKLDGIARVTVAPPEEMEAPFEEVIAPFARPSD